MPFIGFRPALKLIAFAIVVITMVAVGGWYVVSFLPYRNDLETIAMKGEKAIRNIKPSLYPMAVAGETKVGIRSYAMRQAYFSIVFEKHRNNMLSWHANNVLWYFASYIHLTNDEVFGIWVECSFSGCGRGLREASLKYFNTEIDDLSEKEMAGLIAVVRNPARYAPGTALGENRAKQILEKAIDSLPIKNK